jgi:hypothetical protein
MNFDPFPSESDCVTSHKVLGPLDIPIGDRADDFDRLMRAEIDLQHSTRLPDMDVGRRMIEGVDPHLESGFTKDRRHDT